MKKLSIVLALIVLGLVIVGCQIEPSTDELDISDITADVAVIDESLDAELAELDALDQELADLEALDLG